MITYKSGVIPDAAVIANLYRDAQLLRPVDDVERIARMYAGSNLILTAWENDELIGILRGWTDGAFDGYVCDLAIRPDFQKEGVGKALLEMARQSTSDGVQFVLRASKIATEYYKHVGWSKIENGWFYPRTK